MFSIHDHVFLSFSPQVLPVTQPTAPAQTSPDDPMALAPQRRKNNVHLVLFWAAFVVACLVFPGSPADGIVLCPMRAATGLSCPGCGMTRSCTAMMRGDLWHSLEFHPLGWLLVVWLTGMALWRGAELLRGRHVFAPASPRRKRWGKVVTRAIFVFILLFGGVRVVLEIAGILTPV